MTDSSFLGAVREKFKPSAEAVRIATEASGFVDEDSPPDAMLLRAVARMLQAAYAVDAQAVARAIEAANWTTFNETWTGDWPMSGPAPHEEATIKRQALDAALDALGVDPPEMRKEQL